MPRRTDHEDKDDLKLEGGARERAEKVAREGPPVQRDELSKAKREVAQYRAGVALLWDENRILAETGWNAQKFYAVRKEVEKLDEQLAKGTDTSKVWAEYREQQFQCARELEDLAAIFRGAKQFNALVAAVKARSDILSAVLKAGQDLGVVNRASKKIEIKGRVDLNRMSVAEIRVHLRTELQEIESLMVLPEERKRLMTVSNSPAEAVLQRLLAGTKPVVDAESEESRSDVEEPRAPRVRKLVGEEEPE